MRATTLLLILVSSLFAAACVTQPKNTSPAGVGALPTTTSPETMTFGAEADPGPVAAQLGKFLARLEQAERWGRPLLLSTVARRLSLPLPPRCAGWGQVSVVVPPAPEGLAPNAPVTRFLFAVREMKPVDDPEAPHGPEDEPEKKASANGETNPTAVNTCVALLVPGPTNGRLRLGVMPVRADLDWPRVADISSVADFLLVHLAPGRGPGVDAFAWGGGHSLLFFGRGGVRPVGPWPKDAPGLREGGDFHAKLRGSATFGRLVLVLEPPADAPDAPDAPDTADAPDAPDAPDTADAPTQATARARCAWIDAHGKLAAISPVELARLAQETGFSPCAKPDPVEDPVRKEELP